MNSYAKHFEQQQEQMRGIIMGKMVRRALALQSRSKITPTLSKPSLAEMSKMRNMTGGAEIQPLDIYWPGT